VSKKKTGRCRACGQTIIWAWGPYGWISLDPDSNVVRVTKKGLVREIPNARVAHLYTCVNVKAIPKKQDDFRETHKVKFGEAPHLN